METENVMVEAAKSRKNTAFSTNNSIHNCDRYNVLMKVQQKKVNKTRTETQKLVQEIDLLTG